MSAPRRDVLEILRADPLFAVAHYGSNFARMGLFPLQGGGTFAYSPGNHRDPGFWDAVEAQGAARFLLAPNHFHSWGLNIWKERYPDARIVAHPQAMRESLIVTNRRNRVKNPGLGRIR